MGVGDADDTVVVVRYEVVLIDCWIASEVGSGSGTVVSNTA